MKKEYGEWILTTKKGFSTWCMLFHLKSHEWIYDTCPGYKRFRCKRCKHVYLEKI